MGEDTVNFNETLQWLDAFDEQIDMKSAVIDIYIGIQYNIMLRTRINSHTLLRLAQKHNIFLGLNNNNDYIIVNRVIPNNLHRTVNKLEKDRDFIRNHTLPVLVSHDTLRVLNGQELTGGADLKDFKNTYGKQIRPLTKAMREVIKLSIACLTLTGGIAAIIATSEVGGKW